MPSRFILVVVFVCFASRVFADTPIFTARDLIQMEHFNDPDGRQVAPQWNVSPDGHDLLIVTTRGNVATGNVESTLWMLNLQDVSHYLRSDADAPKPEPFALYTAVGRLRASQSDSYGSLITKAKWSADSRSAYILIELHGGQRGLYRMNIAQHKLSRLSPAGCDVTAFSVGEEEILYSGRFIGHRTPRIEVVKSVNDRSLIDLLWPSVLPQWNLYSTARSDGRPIAKMASDPVYNTFAPSPQGHKAIAIVPVQQAPHSWLYYATYSNAYRLYSETSASRRLSEIDEYALVDTASGTQRPLLTSPTGKSGGYFDAPQVLWSDSGQAAVVTSTYLPYQDIMDGERLERKHPCAVAYVRVKDRTADCIVFARYTPNGGTKNWAVRRVSFGKTEKEVIVDLRWENRYRTECYLNTGSVWRELSAQKCIRDSSTDAPVRLLLEQNLNEIPSIWAKNWDGKHQRKIWNPNSGIPSNIGTASVYHWEDVHHRVWNGVLLLPVGYQKGTRYPLVIQTHGFNDAEFLSDGAYVTGSAARPLAAAGFVVLQIEDKRIYELQGSPEEARLHDEGYAAAIDSLSEEGIVDQTKVGIIGFSRTSWYVEEALIDDPHRYAAAAIADGVDMSYMQYMTTATSFTVNQGELINGSKPFGAGLRKWMDSAPDFRAAAIRAPLRIQAISPPSLLWEWELYTSLRVQGKPVDMVYFPLGQHILQNPRERMDSQGGNVDWFRFWLKGEEDRDPEKQSQYARWRSLGSNAEH
jgi:hypothetical protein